MNIYKVTILTNNVEKEIKFASEDKDKLLALVDKFISTQYKGIGEVLKIVKEAL